MTTEEQEQEAKKMPINDPEIILQKTREALAKLMGVAIDEGSTYMNKWFIHFANIMNMQAEELSIHRSLEQNITGETVTEEVLQAYGDKLSAFRKRVAEANAAHSPQGESATNQPEG